MKKAAFFILLALLTPSHAFSKNPSVFGIKLMTNEAKFLSKNPLCVRNTSELIHENITLDGMDIYDITMNTDDGRLATELLFPQKPPGGNNRKLQRPRR